MIVCPILAEVRSCGPATLSPIRETETWKWSNKVPSNLGPVANWDHATTHLRVSHNNRCLHISALWESELEKRVQPWVNGLVLLRNVSQN